MASVERDRDRRLVREGRGRGEAEDTEDRDRERLGAEERRRDTSLMSISGHSGHSGFASPVHSSEFSLGSSHSGSGVTDR